MIRRTFLSRIGAAAAITGVHSPRLAEAAVRQTEVARPQVPAADARFQPARHAADDWFELPGKHRFFFDALHPQGADEALLFAGNFFNANRDGYGLESADLAVVIGLRHHATPFAFNDAIWAKYGGAFSDRIAFVDPRTKAVPVVNVHTARYAEAIKRGVHFAVCDMATHFFAGMAARKAGVEPDAVYKELVANTVGNSHFVPAGIVAVNRAQERGYSVAYVG
jgi:intracellular sulfur oxidation DsrE/DsrF family protein